MVPVPDPRLARIAELTDMPRAVPSTVEFVDIAGLVRGAAAGEGLGNRFLAHVREMHAVAHVVRCFEDDNVAHVSGAVSPTEDIAVVQTELALADLETVERSLDRLRRLAGTGDADARARVALLGRLEAGLNAGVAVRALGLDTTERESLRDLHLLTAKPVMYVANVAEDGFAHNPMLDAVHAAARAEGAEVVAACNRIEAEIAELAADERGEFLAALGLEEPCLDRVIRAGHRLLGLHDFFTVGSGETRAWTVARGATALAAAGVIHTDFERGFIRAEVVAYEDFVACGGEQGAREAGRWRLEGRDYVVRDGDIMRFRFNV